MSILPSCHSKQANSFVCAQAGCAKCLEALLVEHKRLIYVVVHRQYPGKCDYADLIQEGWIGLWQAILHYDPEWGSAFSTYAGRAIRNRVWNAVRREWKAGGWREVERRGEILEGVIQAWQTEQIRQAVEEELDSLPKRLRQVIESVYGIGWRAPERLVEVGKRMGISGERVRQLRNEALVLLRLPVLSMRLRSLCERDSRQAYRKARRLNNAWLRSRRGQR
jgi:RNA polymerase sigma factor (sigma-70 family)